MLSNEGRVRCKIQTQKELYNYLQAESVKRKKEGWKYITLPVAKPHKKQHGWMM